MRPVAVVGSVLRDHELWILGELAVFLSTWAVCSSGYRSGSMTGPVFAVEIGVVGAFVAVWVWSRESLGRWARMAALALLFLLAGCSVDTLPDVDGPPLCPLDGDACTEQPIDAPVHVVAPTVGDAGCFRGERCIDPNRDSARRQR